VLRRAHFGLRKESAGCQRALPLAGRAGAYRQRGALSLEAYRARGGLIALERALAERAETLCDDPRLASVGACRLCVVEVDGQSRPVAACTTPLE